MGKVNLLYGGIHTLYLGIGQAQKAQRIQRTSFMSFNFVLLVPLYGLVCGVELLSHSHEVGEGVGVHFFHDLAAVKFDGDLARA